MLIDGTFQRQTRRLFGNLFSWQSKELNHIYYSETVIKLLNGYLFEHLQNSDGYFRGQKKNHATIYFSLTVHATERKKLTAHGVGG